MTSRKHPKLTTLLTCFLVSLCCLTTVDAKERRLMAQAEDFDVDIDTNYRNGEYQSYRIYSSFSLDILLPPDLEVIALNNFAVSEFEFDGTRDAVIDTEKMRTFIPVSGDQREDGKVEVTIPLKLDANIPSTINTC